MREYPDYDAVGLAGLVRSRQVSARELLDEAIARTDKIDPRLNAVVLPPGKYFARLYLQESVLEGDCTLGRIEEK